MYLTWTASFTLVALAAIVGFWHSSLAAREHANRAAVDACERLRLQFLDGTVAFARLEPTRGQGGKLALRRTYVFDYTADSIQRRQGFVILTGRKVESVGFAHQTGDAHAVLTANLAEDAPPLPEASRTPPADNVLDFAEWRRRSRQRAPADRRGQGERKG